MTTIPALARRYVSCADTAKLMRAALKQRFPGVSFSVRSKVYSGGASISVRYTDGPKPFDVHEIIDEFAHGRFDGMTDSMSYTSELRLTANGPEDVHYGADFVFLTRDYTEAVWSEWEAKIVASMDRQPYGMIAYRSGFPDNLDLNGRDDDARTWTHRILHQLELPATKAEGSKGGCMA